MRRIRRVVGLVRLGAHRTAALAVDSRQVALAVLGVALTVMLVTTVGGIALGLASQGTVTGDDVDYRIVPAASSAESVAVAVDGPKLGDVHRVTDRLSADERIEYATPVELQVVQLTAASGPEEYVLVVGVVPAVGQSIAGLPVSALTAGDPYYANGSYDGAWTGEMVVSEAAGRLLDADVGTTLRPASASDRSFTVVARHEAESSSGPASVPVAVVHLAELQSIAGSADADHADQVLVRTDDPSVRADLAGVYPETEVVAGGGLSTRRFAASNLPLAVAITTVLTAVVVGVLLVATTMGLAVTDDRQFLATLAALGFSAPSRLLLVLVEVVVVAVLGGVVGMGLGVVGIAATNLATRELFGVSVAVLDGRILVADLVVSVLIGVLAAAYPLWLGRRTSVVEVLDA
ncbi:FtsX-like permease family protein [Salinigranum salinum]|uniref:FtsX-like permease family protein n=1 Tax=Salinigranum salinum TaxID=1364937 RepID=UPI001260D6F9|nr:FtsX-like permease family protein [Salinigranum salinum]